MEYILKTYNLTKAFHNRNAVNKVNMSIRKGDIYGFIGKNGAGKTTLMRMVAGLAAPTAGTMELFGSKNLKQQRIRIGSIIENPGIYLNMTAKENLEVFRKIYGIPEKDSVTKMLQIVGLEDTGNKKAKKFSLGMKQRLGIAIALLGNPDFLVLDEPINGLDPAGIKEIRDLMLKLNQEQAITILISSHILGELSKIATCYGIIKDGNLVEEFSKEELEVRCKRCLKIQVDKVEQATHILENILGITNYDVLPDKTIRVFERIEESAQINAAIIKNNISLYSSYEAGQDLEGYFMDKLGGKEND